MKIIVRKVENNNRVDIEHFFIKCVPQNNHNTLTLQKRGSILYNLSSFSASDKGCGGCVYSAKSFFRCINPSWTCEELEPSAESDDAADVAPRNLRIRFITKLTNNQTTKTVRITHTYLCNREKSNLVYHIFVHFIGNKNT